MNDEKKDTLSQHGVSLWSVEGIGSAALAAAALAGLSGDTAAITRATIYRTDFAGIVENLS